MSDTKNENHLAQIANIVLALSKEAAKQNPEGVKMGLVEALNGSREGGSGDSVVLEIFEKVFPGAQVPDVISVGPAQKANA